MLPPRHDSDVSAPVCGTESGRQYLKFTELLRRSRAAAGCRATTAQQPRIARCRLGAVPGVA